jgi:hypothetical protein
MVVMADCETELELNGLKIPITLAVVENLGYDLIIGMDVLRQTQAVFDVETNILTLYRGLTACSAYDNSSGVYTRPSGCKRRSATDVGSGFFGRSGSEIANRGSTGKYV